MMIDHRYTLLTNYMRAFTRALGIPIVFDYHHHKFRNDGESEEEALRLAASTWGDVTPVVHYSESMSKRRMIHN